MSPLMSAAERRYDEWRGAVTAHHRRGAWSLGLALLASVTVGIFGREPGLVAMVFAIVTYVVVSFRLSRRREEAHRSLLCVIEVLRLEGDEGEVEFANRLSQRAIDFCDGVATGLGRGP